VLSLANEAFQLVRTSRMCMCLPAD